MLLEPTVESLVGAQYGRRGSHALDELPDQQARLSGVYVDGTFGRGGHSRALLASLSADARLVVFDKDPQASRNAHVDKVAREELRMNVIAPERTIYVSKPSVNQSSANQAAPAVGSRR